MYKNRYFNCGPACKCGDEDVLGDAQKGIDLIKSGFKDVLCGLDLICCRCRISEGIRCIERGLCKIEKGLDAVIDGLKCIEFECDYRNNGNIKNGICGIQDGIRHLKRGVCQLNKCCLCDGIESVQCGLRAVEEGLCYLIKGIDDIRGERERKCECCC